MNPELQIQTDKLIEALDHMETVIHRDLLLLIILAGLLVMFTLILILKK